MAWKCCYLLIFWDDFFIGRLEAVQMFFCDGVTKYFGEIMFDNMFSIIAVSFVQKSTAVEGCCCRATQSDSNFVS